MTTRHFLECVPNFSEGQRREVIEAVAGAANRGPTKLLDAHSDADHNRSVLTLAGPASDLIESAVAATRQAIASIDLQTQVGEHPRLGAMDVIPFIPIASSTMSEAIHAATTCAKRISEELGVACFLFGFAAIRRHTKALDLPEVRRAAFETLTPDFGPSSPSPSAGAVSIGARDVLVAFNVNLETTDVAIAKRIAAKLRASAGGLSYLRAMGFNLRSRRLVQVSMNLTRPAETTVASAFDAVADIAASEHVRAVESEIVGLVPRAALEERDWESLLLPGPPKILEEELAQLLPD